MPLFIGSRFEPDHFRGIDSSGIDVNEPSAVCNRVFIANTTNVFPSGLTHGGFPLAGGLGTREGLKLRCYPLHFGKGNEVATGMYIAVSLYTVDSKVAQVERVTVAAVFLTGFLD